MKILVAYDGSNCSDAAIDDLENSGLPAAGTALVISVAEAWLPRTPSGKRDRSKRDKNVSLENEVLAVHAKKLIEGVLPEWKVETALGSGSPAAEILARADQFLPDLIVVGAQGRSAIGRLVLGSISQKVLTEARVSVRVCRERSEEAGTPVRIMLGFDGSDGSFAAVNAVACRDWPSGSKLRLVSAAERRAPADIDRFMAAGTQPGEDVSASERNWLEKQAEKALKMLEIPASFDIVAGDPRQVLTEEAAHWNADCIFLGADTTGSPTGQSLLGSTAAAIAARASSSVEVVRARN